MMMSGLIRRRSSYSSRKFPDHPRGKSFSAKMSLTETSCRSARRPRGWLRSNVMPSLLRFLLVEVGAPVPELPVYVVPVKGVGTVALQALAGLQAYHLCAPCRPAAFMAKGMAINCPISIMRTPASGLVMV